MTPRIYRMSADPLLVDSAGPPPRAETRRLTRVHWDVPDDEFSDVPVLRRWLNDHGVDEVAEQGITVWDTPLPPDREPYWCSKMPTWISWRGGRGELTRSEPCVACALPVSRVAPSTGADARSVVLLARKLADAPLCFIAGENCVAMRPDLAEELRAEELDEGLITSPLGSVSDVLLAWSDAWVGGPAYPYGPEPCALCGRASRRVDGKPRFVRPNYAFDLTFDSQPRHWSWSSVYGQNMPLVSHRVAEFLRARMPRIAFSPHGRPDTPGVFLHEDYR